MAEANVIPSTTTGVKAPFPGVIRNLARFLVARISALVLSVTVAVYLTILIANFGGYVDEIIRNNVAGAILGMVQGGWLRDVPDEERAEIIAETTRAMEAAAGLNEPFLLRTVRWLGDGLTLDWGEANRPGLYSVGSSDREVRPIIVNHLSRTVLIFGVSNLLLFFVTVSLALSVTRRYGSLIDRVLVGLSPLSAAPAWAYGVILNALLLRFVLFSTGGTFDAWPDDFRFSYLPILLRHLLPPLIAFFLSGLFQGIYIWRTFFLVFSNEDYVEMARAKGLTDRMVERKYVLRPALPTLITGFALLAMSLWQEVIALEYFFNVAGIGRLFVTALNVFDTPVIVGLVVTFAYLLALTVLLLDIVYALVDPRIRIGGRGGEVKTGRNVVSRRAAVWARIRPATQGRDAVPRALLKTPAKAAGNGIFWTRLLRSLAGALWRSVKESGRILRSLKAYPAAVLGLAIIFALVAVSIYAVVSIPYSQAISLWRGEGEVWTRNPKGAYPAWINLFRAEDLPPTLILDKDSPGATTTTQAITEEITEILITIPIDYRYGGFPQELNLDMNLQYAEKVPHVTLFWRTPDGREIQIANPTIRARSMIYHFTQDDHLKRKLGDQDPEEALFADPAGASSTPLKGTYELEISGLFFEDTAGLDVEFIVYGQVHGLAGTDTNRRDLMVALLWGAPVALSFGLVAAIVTSISGMLLAAMGAWFGGWVDGLIQLLTEVNLILPFFPVSLMIYTLYSKSILAILGVTVALSIFGTPLKTYRATFLQVKESVYIEAALAYGASRWRIVGRYLIPRIRAVLIPRLVILVPSYVFLEATLAFLGVSDPVLPTWGKLVVAALSHGVYREAYHLVLIPLGLLLLTGFAFAMVGLALERVFDPRLRSA